jgi:transposase InsO family protein
MTMPWKETNVMDERINFVLKSFHPNINFTELCSDFCISTKTGYKWKDRFFKYGYPGLVDRPKTPYSHPKKIGEDIICELIRIKLTKLNWGPKKVRLVYIQNHPKGDLPSRSSVERILNKAGLVLHKRRRRQYKSERIQNGFIPKQPNDLWTVDFKGWWYTTKREKCEPLTVRDAVSKYILSIKILDKGDISCVRKEFEHIFTLYGLPRVIRSDNGPPFASGQSLLGLTKLSVWWMSLGIQLDRIDPGSPYQNGAHERMHLDMKNELEGKINGDLKLHQSIFNVWKDEFNRERPHEALGMETPAQVYIPSDRIFHGTNYEILYPSGYIPRKVNDRGFINYKGRRVFISIAFSGYYIGLQRGKDIFIVWFSNFNLGEIDLKSFLFHSIVSIENMASKGAT